MYGITTQRTTTTMARHHPSKRRTRTVATWALVLASLHSSSFSPSPTSSSSRYRRLFVAEAHLLRGPSPSSGVTSSSSSAIQHANRHLMQTEDVDANQNHVPLEMESDGGDRDLARKNDGNGKNNNRGRGKWTKEERERIKRENEERKKRNQQNRDRKKNRDSNNNNSNKKNKKNNNNDGQQKMKKEELKQYLDKMERKKNDEGKLTIKEMKEKKQKMKEKKQQQLMQQKAEKLDKQEKKGKKDDDEDEDEKLTKKEQKQQNQQMKFQNGQVKLNKQQKKDQEESEDDNKDKLTKKELKEKKQQKLQMKKDKLDKQEKKDQMKQDDDEDDQDKLTKKELKEQKQQMKLQKEQAKLDKQEKKEKLQDEKDDQDKLTKQEKKEQMMVLQNANQEKLSKEELKELMKLTDNKFNFEHVGGSGGSKNDKDKDKDKNKPDKNDKPDKNNGSAASFVLTDQPQAQSLQLDVDEEEEEDEKKKPKKDKDKDKNDKDKDKDEDENKPSEDMAASFTLMEEQPQAQAFQIQSIDNLEEDEDDSTPTYNTLNPNKVFLSTYPDKSTPLDSFEHSSTLQWNLGSSATAWSHVDNQVTPAYDGNVSIMSGLSSIKDLTQLEGEDGTKGKKVHSDLSLTTDQDFEGGVITFMVKWNMVLPNEAFYVMVDGQLALAPLAPAESSDDMEWIEYGVPVEEGQHLITWSHIYNPFGLDALPPRPKGLGDVPNLYMDDVRLYPFSEEGVQGFEGDGKAKTSSLEMTTSGDATWIIQDGASSAGSYSIVASSDDISSSSGNADVSFVVASSRGGTLKYNILSSTTAPHDDFCILLNGEKADVVFGQSPTFESRRLDIPPGKVEVTLRHRKNPGELSRMLLDTLGAVGTEGKTWLDDVRFEPRNN